MTKNTRNAKAIDTDTFRAAFLGNLQRLQDFVQACESGLDLLKPEQYDAHIPRGGLMPAPHLKLDCERAQGFSRFWLARSVFRDIADFVHDYLDHAFNTCSYVASVSPANLSKDRIDLMRPLHAFQKKGMPEKFEVLARNFELHSPWTEQVLSVNRVRNCLVHRVGLVREQDLGKEGALVLRLLRLKLPERLGTPTGRWAPHVFNKSQATVEPYERVFKYHEHLSFDAEALNDCLATMVFFEHSMVEPLVAFYKRCGINVTRTEGVPMVDGRRTL